MSQLPKLVLAALAFVSPYCIANEQVAQKNFIFCYENKAFPPHFIGESTLVPKNTPGAVIDVLRAVDNKLVEIKMSYIRQPWSRCIKNLKAGEVTAVIGSYSKTRALFGAYPTKDGQLDNTKAFDHLATCLITRKEHKEAWQGKPLAINKASIAIPLGYAVKKELEQLNFAIYQTNSLASAYELLRSHRVHYSIIDCKAKTLPDFVKLLRPPIREHYGYFIINKDFYLKNTKLSNKLWLELSKIDKHLYRQKYLNKGLH